MRLQISRHRFGGAFEILGDAGIALRHISRRNFDFVRFGFLNLKRLIDQVAQHLHAQTFFFRSINLAAIGKHDERHALVHVGTREDLTIDDSGRLAKRWLNLSKGGKRGGQVETGGWNGAFIANGLSRSKGGDGESRERQGRNCATNK